MSRLFHWKRDWSLPASVLLALLFALHFALVVKFSVDVPHWDEWDEWWGWTDGRVVEWALARHNEHRIVPTKIQFYLLNLLNGGNQRVHLALNFLLYGCLVAGVLASLHKACGVSKTVLALFGIFLFSTISHENHLWAFQSQFHWVLAFLFAAAYLLFSGDQAPGRVALGAFFLTAAPFAFSAGVVGSLALAAVYALFKASRREWAGLFVVLAVLGAGVALWASGFARLEGHPVLVYPSQWAFWSFWANAVAGGFATAGLSFAAGVFWILVLLLPFAWEWREGKRSSSFWLRLSYVGFLFGLLASIAVGRGGWGPAGSRASRYTEFAIFLVPLSASGLFCVLREKARSRALVALWLLIAWNYRSHFSTSPYRQLSRQQSQGLSCLAEAAGRKGEIRCPTVYPGLLNAHLERARRNGASFLKALPPS
jgi:hypothetical protein